MMNWINWKMGIFLILNILITECIIGSLEAARYAAYKDTNDLSKSTKWILRIFVVAVSTILSLQSLICQMTALATYVVLGTIWSKSKSFKDNRGGEAAATAVLLLCIPISIGVIWNVSSIIITTGWDTDWRQLLWLSGPIVAIVILIIASSGKSEDENEGRKRTDWIPTLIVFILLVAVAIATWVCSWKGGMLS